MTKGRFECTDNYANTTMLLYTNFLRFWLAVARSHPCSPSSVFAVAATWEDCLVVGVIGAATDKVTHVAADATAKTKTAIPTATKLLLVSWVPVHQEPPSVSHSKVADAFALKFVATIAAVSVAAHI